MQEQHDKIVRLLLKSVNNEPLTPEEESQLNDWINQSPHNRKVFEDVSNAPLLEKEVKALIGYDEQKLWRRIDRGIHGKPGKGRIIHFFQTFSGRVAAAVLLLIIGAGAYFIVSRASAGNGIANQDTTSTKPLDLNPGVKGEGVVLELANGKTILLDDASNGTLTSNITKQDGQITYVYGSQTRATSAELVYNTVRTPKGIQYKAVLADGSAVWINASSALKSPDAFASDERRVMVDGQAYFEVAKDAKKPFRVEVKGMMIEVLGTHFAISSYPDEITRSVTLLEGSVKVKSGDGKEALLTPGQQVQLAENGNLEVINNADIDKIMSWKNNSFYFQDDNIETIMREISRWYPVDKIVYEGRVTKKYTAKISRTKPVSSIFEYLKLSGGVNFTITKQGESTTIVVKPE
jgi:transmembrane sensor